MKGKIQNAEHSPLFLSIKMGETQILRYIYENAGMSIDLDKLRTHHGFVPLTYAAYCKQPEIVSFLSLRVRDLNPIDPLGHSTLSRCILNNHYEAAMKLISRGSDINL